MSNHWERLFATPQLPKNNLPDITPEQAPLFRMQAEQRTDYLNQIKKEGMERNEADIQLREEMHSFGMIPCGWFDSDTKIIAVKPSKRQSVLISAKRFTPPTATQEHWMLVDATQSCLLDPLKWIIFHCVRMEQDETGLVTKITGVGTIYNVTTAFPADITITRGAIDIGGDSVIITIEGSGALIIGGSPVFPIEGENASVKITDFENGVKFFK